MRGLYRHLMPFLLPLFFVRLWVKSRHDPRLRQHWAERLGFYKAPLPAQAIWIHAVSVGETRATAPLVTALEANYPGVPILMTHMTAAGRAMGQQLFEGRVRQVYLPYDAPGPVTRFLSAANPRFGLLMETELWPTLIESCHQKRVPVGLINARLSKRSARAYQRIGGFIRRTLGELAFVGAQTEADARRLKALGARHVTVTGNLKFEAARETPDQEQLRALRTLIGPDRPVLLWASTREGEEALLVKAWLKAPIEGALVILVPRHPQRFQAVDGLLKTNNINYLKRSEWSLNPDRQRSETDFILGDSMGEMALWYALADLAFVGGSLLPLGGQNVLEALAQGCPVLVGPHTFNFTEAVREGIEAGAVCPVHSADELMARTQALLSQAARLHAMGEAGKALVAQHQGATEKTLRLFRT